jgi:hypothetical protein
MLPRPLPLLCMLLLSEVCLSQHQSNTPAVPETCPATKPSDQPFVPPSPYPSKRAKGSFWFGTDRLWTQLPVTGTWGRLGHYTPDDPTFRQKLFFWRQGYDPHTERSSLKITGKRIDSPAPPLLSDSTSPPLLVDEPTSGSWTDNDSFIVAGINFPTTGCWEITGRYETDEVTFIVWLPQ